MFEVTVLDETFNKAEVGTFDLEICPAVGEAIAEINARVTAIDSVNSEAQTATVVVEWLD